MRLIFLGCGDQHGVPRVGCTCATCREALSPDSRNNRTGPSIAIQYGPAYAERVVLVDSAPEFRLQATRAGLSCFDALLVTHAHEAHILGLSTLALAQREAGRPLSVYAPPQVMEAIHVRFDHLWRDKSYSRIWQPKEIDAERIELWGLEVHALRVNHGAGGAAYGYLFTYDTQRAAYIPDMLQASPDVRQALQGLDLLILGTDHYYEGIDLWKRSSMDLVSGLQLIREVMPVRALFTHLSHTINYQEISAKLPEGVQLAYDTLHVEVNP